MRVPTIFPRRQVETIGVCYAVDQDDIDQLRAENESLRKRLLDAHDRANALDDARHAEARRQESLFQIIAEFTDDDWHGPLHCDHLDALPIGTVIRAKGLAWTRIGIDYASGRSLWLTPTKDDTVDSIDLDTMGGTVTLAWVPTEKEMQA